MVYSVSIKYTTQCSCVSVHVPGIRTVCAEISKQKALTRALTLGLFDPVTIQTHAINLRRHRKHTKQVQKAADQSL